MPDNDLFEVAPDMQKNLSRNVPSDFGAYLEQVGFSLRSNNRAPNRQIAKEIDRMADCLLQEPDDDLKAQLLEFVNTTWLRYEALNRSIDFHVAPRPVYQALDAVISTMEKTAHRKLNDEFRDERVAQDRGLMGIKELNIEDIEFAEAKSLAEKVTLARLKLLSSVEELTNIRDHFKYKMSLTSAGKPGAYSMFYAVFALGAFFEEHNTHGDKAQVNTFKTIHSGKFLEFVHTFFGVANSAVAMQAGETFPESVRKIAQKRVSDPDCYQLLDGDASTQDLLNFMDRVDRAR